MGGGGVCVDGWEALRSPGGDPFMQNWSSETTNQIARLLVCQGKELEASVDIAMCPVASQRNVGALSGAPYWRFSSHTWCFHNPPRAQ